MAKQVIKILDDLSPSDIKLRDLPRKPDGLYNMHFNKYGQLVKRAGHSEYNESSIGSDHKIVGMHRFYRQNTAIKEFLVAWNEGIYTLSDTSPYGATLIKSGLTADSDTYFYDFYNHCYFVNGVDGLFKCTLGDEIAGTRTSDTVFTRTAGTWSTDSLIGQYVFSYVNTDSTAGKWTIITDNDADTVTISGTLYAGANRIKISTVRTAGVNPPTAAPTGTSPATGNLSEGNYKVCYTYVDEDGKEGNASASVTIAASTDDKISLDIVVSTDKKVTKRRIYRTIVNGAIFYYDKEVDNNTAITVDLTQADSTLGQKTVLHTDHTAPPSAPHLGTKRRSRAYIAQDGIVYISNLTEPEYFPLVTGQYIWTGNEQKVTGLLEQLTGLPVFTDDSIERLLGTDRKNFEFKNSYATEGNIAIRSLVNCDNLLVYLEFDGIHYFDGVSTGIFSEALNEYIKDNINRTYASLSCATYYDDKYLLCYAKGSSTTPSETIYYDFVTKTYGVYSFDFSCFSRWDRGTDGLRLFGGSNTEGRVYELDTGLEDNGANITAYDKIEPLDFGKPEVYKQFYSIIIKIKSTTATTLTMYYTLDDEDETSKTKTIIANTTKWYRISLGGGGKRARSIAPRPYISDKYAFEIHGLMICYEDETFAEEKE